MDSNSEPSGMNFQKIVLVVAVIVFIIALSVLGFMLSASIQSKPPPFSECPDKWGLTGTNICQNKVKSDGYFDNVGTFITDVSCNLTGASGSPNLCSKIIGWTGTKCITGWVQGNTTNGLDDDNCYLLASRGINDPPKTTTTPEHIYQITSPLLHELSSSLTSNVEWAKAYEINWDGLT